MLSRWCWAGRRVGRPVTAGLLGAGDPFRVRGGTCRPSCSECNVLEAGMSGRGCEAEPVGKYGSNLCDRGLDERGPVSNVLFGDSNFDDEAVDDIVG